MKKGEEMKLKIKDGVHYVIDIKVGGQSDFIFVDV
jgi:hypothetical protein